MTIEAIIAWAGELEKAAEKLAAEAHMLCVQARLVQAALAKQQQKVVKA